jgi:hypothetical protein
MITDNVIIWLMRLYGQKSQITLYNGMSFGQQVSFIYQFEIVFLLTGVIHEADAGRAAVCRGQVHGHLPLAGDGGLRRAGLLPLEQRW